MHDIFLSRHSEHPRQQLSAKYSGHEHCISSGTDKRVSVPAKSSLQPVPESPHM